MEKDANSEVRRALCFGCWLQAGVLATIENGKVVKLKGEPGHPVNQGWICERSKAFSLHRTPLPRRSAEHPPETHGQTGRRQMGKSLMGRCPG
jgi:anaerobic selenocysteine-containing dehydrogenase